MVHHSNWKLGRRIVYIDGDRFVGGTFHTRHLEFGRRSKVASDKMGQADVMKMEYIVSFDHFDSFGKMLTICDSLFEKSILAFQVAARFHMHLKPLLHIVCTSRPNCILELRQIAVFVSTVLLLRVCR